MPDVDIQVVFIAIVIAAPDRFAQGVIGDDAPPVIQKLLQNGALRCRQGYGASRGGDGGIPKIHSALSQMENSLSQ